MQAYLVKSISTGESGLIGVESKDRVVEGYFSIYGNVDSDGDMIMPGAFTKSLKENGSRIKHLWQHDPRHPLARPIITDDQKGLRFRSTISDTSLGRDVIKLYQDGVIDEHSIGFNTIKAQQKDGYNEMTQLRLWEGSSVTWGANMFSLGGPAKSRTKEDIIARMDAVYKALRNGRYETEELFELLDIHHAQLKQMVSDAITTPAADESAPEPGTVTPQDDTELNERLKALLNIFNKQ